MLHGQGKYETMQNCGIDVSKSKLDCAWLRDPETGKLKTKALPNNIKGFGQLTDWLIKQAGEQPSEIHIVMEATGVYHEALALYLFEQGFRVSVANPLHVKRFAESLAVVHKTDKKDSIVLAKFCHSIKPQLWQPEALEVRELKALLARLEALEKDLQREENRQEKANISQASDIVIESLAKMIEVLKAEKKRLENQIDDHIDKYPHLRQNRQLMESIPGVGPVVSRVMLSVMESRSFKNAGQLAAFLGLIPKLRESGTFKGRTMLSKTGPAGVRATLYMAAVVAIRHNPDIKRQYERLLQNGKTSMQAIGAAMRKLVQICFGVVKHQDKYRPQLA